MALHLITGRATAGKTPFVYEPLREAAMALGLVSAADFDKWIDPAAMTRPEGE